MSGCHYFAICSKVFCVLAFTLTVTVTLLLPVLWNQITTKGTHQANDGGGKGGSVNDSDYYHDDMAGLETLQPEPEAEPAFERNPFGPYELQQLALFEATLYQTITNSSSVPAAAGLPGSLFKEWRQDYEDSSSHAQESAPLAGFKLGSSHAEIIAGHPLLVYRMIRRTLYMLIPIRDLLLPELNKTAADGTATGVASALLLQYRMRWPTQQHFNFSMFSVLKLQDVYQLKASDIAKGLIARYDTGITLRKVDAFEIGRLAVEEKLYTLAFEWFQLVRYWDEMMEITDEDEGSVCEIELQKAVQLLVERHDLGFTQLYGPPGSGAAQMYYFMEPLQNTTKFLNSTPDVAAVAPPLKTRKQHFSETIKGQLSEDSASTDFYAVCNGENLQPTQVRNSLRCYLKKDLPELQVFPAKVEEISKEPPLLRFYDLFGSKMAGLLKELSKSTQYTEYYQLSDGTSVLDRYEVRQSTASWVYHTSDERLRYFIRRIESITDLNHYENKSSDPFEIVAYPVGGSFFVHQDALEVIADKVRGDRITTLFFYIDEPIAGGWTAHPRMGVANPPTFGTGLLWYNLYRNGSTDRRSIHGGCPVILGAKWGSNTCATEHGNFLRWKCLSQLE